jgi:hypothetical protein
MVHTQLGTHLTFSGMTSQIIPDLGIHVNVEVDSRHLHGDVGPGKVAALRKKRVLVRIYRWNVSDHCCA